jgi:DNA polymerase-1
MAKWLLVDGFNLAYRCFFAIPDLTRADGFPTNALHGWVKSLWMLADQEKPDGTLVFFDLGGSQDRLALHPEYKAQREEMPEALQKQIEPLKKLTRLLGCVLVEQDGVESDDLLAAEAAALAREGDESLIVSSDKDFAQMVGDRIQIMLPPPTGNPKAGWRRLDPAGVKEKFGVPPSQIAEYLAIVGDKSDNIPGIDGVGPKTAAKWLEAHGTLEEIIAHAAELKPDRFREVVAANADRLRLNLRLTTLNLSLQTVPIRRAEPQATALFAMLEEMEMKGTLATAQKRYSGQAEMF